MPSITPDSSTPKTRPRIAFGTLRCMIVKPGTSRTAFPRPSTARKRTAAGAQGNRPISRIGVPHSTRPIGERRRHAAACNQRDGRQDAQEATGSDRRVEVADPLLADVGAVRSRPRPGGR